MSLGIALAIGTYFIVGLRHAGWVNFGISFGPSSIVSCTNAVEHSCTHWRDRIRSTLRVGRDSNYSSRVPTPSEQIAARFVEEVGFLLSRLRAQDTAIEGAVVWFAAGEYSRTEVAYGPKILVALGTALIGDGLANAVSVTIATPPRVLGTLPTDVMTQVVQFIEKNC
ncbi:MAG TPA: hypothetical protein VG963_27685, partial [Polyangiaceae bacterium]|nr:hypothetical protein [Polyangiaceae bacterium]